MLGRVRKVEKSLGGAFVDIGDQMDGFLSFNTLLPEDKKAGLTEGRAILVRIARAGFAEKGAKLDGRVSLKPPGAETPVPSMVQAPAGVLTRTLHDAGANPAICWIADGRWRDRVAKHIPEANIRQLDQDDSVEWVGKLEDHLDITLSKKPTYPFPGGNLIVELTSAVATIDVNLAPNHLQGKAEAQLAGNLMAASWIWGAVWWWILSRRETTLTAMLSPNT